MTQTSLERLKALDSLSSLHAQLQEAQQLCNHSSRAEMILRWLTNKLKNSSEARTNAASWELLASSIRLLSVLKIASLLGSGTLQEILRLAAAERVLSDDALQALSTAWKVLYQLGQTASGAAIKALLRIDGPAAAELCGNWCQRVLEIIPSKDSRSDIEAAASLLPVGLQIWALRGRSNQDDTTFSDKCLLPASQLIVLLRRGEHRASKRRRVIDNQEDIREPTRTLESMIAKHSILPARSAFMTAQSQRQASIKGRSTKHKSGQNVLRTIEPLKLSSEIDPAVVTLLLEISLSAVATPTPGLRNREAPWIETLFNTLLGLVGSSGNERYTVTTAAMLQHLHSHKMSLPTQRLVTLSAEALADSSACKEAVSHLLAAVARLSPGVLTDLSIARKIFARTGEWQTSDSATTFSDLVRDQVLAPVITTFAQKQQIPDLLKLWHEQLQSANDSAAHFWLSLGQAISAAIASTANDDMVNRILQQYSLLLRALAESQQSLTEVDIADRLRADLALLRVVLQGIRNKMDQSGALQQEIELMRSRLISLKHIDAKSVSAACRVQIWQLLAVIVQLRSPAKIASQPDKLMVISWLEEMAASHIFQVAVEDCSKQAKGHPAVQMLLSVVCNLLQSYAGSQALKAIFDKAIRALCAGATQNLAVLAEHPHLATTLPQEEVIAVLRKNDSVDAQHARYLLAGLLKNSNTSDSTDTLSDISAYQLAALSPSSLSSRQSTELVRRLLDASAGNNGQHSPAHTLALVCDVLKYPAKGLSIQQTLLKLLEYALEQITRCKDEPDTIEHSLCLLQPLVQAIFQSGSPPTLEDCQDISLLIVKAIDLLKVQPDADSVPVAIVVCTAIALLEASSKNEETVLGYRNKKDLNALAQKIVTALENFAANPQPAHNALFASVTEAILILPSSVWSQTGSKQKKYEQAVVKASESILKAVVGSSDRAIAASFRLMCKFGTDRDITSMAVKTWPKTTSLQATVTIVRACEEALSMRNHPDAIAAYISATAPGDCFGAQLQLCAIKGSKGTFTAGAALNNSWSHLLQLLVGTTDIAIRVAHLRTMAALAKLNGVMLNQYCLEHTLQVLHDLISTGTHHEAFCPEICKMLKILINQYRTRLQGRFHLVIMIFQSLLANILDDASVASERLRESHARTMAKLLQLFCKPVWVRSSALNLVDASREAQKYAGQFVQHILHHYCGLLLSSTPAESVRLALRPGIFAVVEAMEAHDEGSVRALSAAMNSSERAILRMAIQDWRQFGKWEGS